ncbi:Abi family protein [Collinsella aerofaciens]|uniref:Abi family protein n=1 Tax=Collinsella aerofaciens TaxID=74426 RepID=UPI00359C94D0
MEPPKAAVPIHEKPLLTVEEQIVHLKSKGVTFDSRTEAEAADCLAGKRQFFKATAYRKLFDKHVGGEKDGQYIDLDFAQLKYLAGLDRRLRDTLLPMALDVEHFTAARLLKAAEDNSEDGYAVMRDYMESVPTKRRKYIENELEIRSSDAYCGAVIRKYRDDMPIWSFVEVVSFGTFIGLTKFCANRWEDGELLASHYLLKKAKSVRNASAHSLIGNFIRTLPTFIRTCTDECGDPIPRCLSLEEKWNRRTDRSAGSGKRCRAAGGA